MGRKSQFGSRSLDEARARNPKRRAIARNDQSREGRAANLASNPTRSTADLWLLGCPNGTLDLRTGKRREARREDYITKKIGAEFDPKADCRQWRGFLDWATQGDVELAAFLRMLAGYALTGEVREEVMCALVGDGANGKSTFLMTLFDLLGDYAAKARSDLLVHAQGKEGAPSPDVAALQGKRLVIVSETEDGCSLSEARIKDIVSNEVIAARRLHRDPFTFRPNSQNHPVDQPPAARQRNRPRHLAAARSRAFQCDDR